MKNKEFSQVKAIIFDKDGTLLDFDAYWAVGSEKVMEDFLTRIGRNDISCDEILPILGIHNGVCDINSVFCQNTFWEISEIIYEFLIKKGCSNLTRLQTYEFILEAYDRISDLGVIKPTCNDLRALLEKLKKQGIRLAVVTTDTAESTQKCLSALGIHDLFDKIYTDDGNAPNKPDPYAAFDFCRTFGLDKENVIMVGDTMTDIKFARNAGIKVISIAKNSENKKILAPHADAVIQNPSFLSQIIDLE